MPTDPFRQTDDVGVAGASCFSDASCAIAAMDLLPSHSSHTAVAIDARVFL
jgi:hypothetical protein